FGRAIRSEWPLDPAIAYLNHGTVGVTPRAVLAAQTAIRDEIETNPSLHVLRRVTPMLGGEERRGALREAAERVAAFLGARGDDLVFVDNDTTGINAVLHSFDLGPGDDVLVTSTTYGGVRQAVRYACRRSGASMVVAEDPSPIGEPGEVLAAVERAITPRTRLAVLDHIVSETGVVLPIADLVALCRARGGPDLRVLVDGAHVPGQLALDVPAIGADWYAANLHKWAFAPRSCGVLWAAPAAQEDLHPAVVSWNLDGGFTAEFDWTGTRDPSAFLAAPAGISFLESLGFAAARAYNHRLLWEGVSLLGERWAGGEPGEGWQVVAPESMSGAMTAVRLPAVLGGDRTAAERLRDALLFEHGVEVSVFPWRERLWVRLAVQVYNETEDFERLAAGVDALR
ncbi:MAG TPA: aminotransferase class V-fold PLP-dependent enzyme, partial [Thermoanaerobaculia bacterium]|nr:aminotransferase class V-fold PLP-dependent enzyme [Thermoanaerobaculia bacterium]